MNNDYLVAWAKTMMGENLSASEKTVFENVNKQFSNEYTHTTGTSTVLIPEEVQSQIWSRAEERYPLLKDVRKFNIKGKLTMTKHTAIVAGDAAWYTEGTPVEDEQNTFDTFTLDGHELAKNIKVSWKLKSMAAYEFVNYITEELSKRIGVAAAKAVAKGTGTGQPRGVETALLAEVSTPQVITYSADTSDPLSYSKITQAVSLVHPSHIDTAAIYANSETIWNQLANIKDNNGRPMFVPDVTDDRVGRMFGLVVKPDASITDGSVLIGNAAKGYVLNTLQPLSVSSQDEVKNRETLYAAYTIMDGDVLDEKAFSLIRRN